MSASSKSLTHCLFELIVHNCYLAAIILSIILVSHSVFALYRFDRGMLVRILSFWVKQMHALSLVITSVRHDAGDMSLFAC